jgi:uncharacterized protein
MTELKNPQGEKLDHHFHKAERRDTLLILGHGLTGDKDRPLLVALAEALSARGWPCLRVSFSGNGASEGKFEDSNITKQVADLKAVLDTVPDYVRIAYAGHSMGAATGVCAAADDLRIQALISLAGMVHCAQFAEREFAGLVSGRDCIWEDASFPLSEALVSDMRRIDSVLPIAGRLTQSWLLLHGLEDDVVPVSDSRDVHAAVRAKSKLVEIPAAGHVFCERSHLELVEACDAWLRQCIG